MALQLAEKGDANGLKDLLAVDTSSLEVVDKDGNTALIISSWCGNDEVVEVLIRAGARLNAANKDKFTALMLAARDGHVAIVRALLDAGARDDLVSKIGFNALDYAEQQGHLQVKKILMANRQKKRAESTSNLFSTDGGGGGNRLPLDINNITLNISPPLPPSSVNDVVYRLPPSLSLVGKVAIVTGCGSDAGIGFAIAQHLVELGSAVVITSTTERIFRRVAELKANFPNCKVIGSYGDLTSDVYCRSLVDLAVSTFNQIDILVNNAGMTSVSSPASVFTPEESGDAISLKYEGWRNSLSRNLDTMFLMTKYALPQIILRPKGSGRVINIASTTGPVNATTGDVGYATAKAGMTGFTKAVALDVAKYGITCNAVCPGWIATESQIEFEASQGTYCPLKRSGSPKEIASCVGYLASPGSSYLTGQSIVIDGGNSIDEARAI